MGVFSAVDHQLSTGKHSQSRNTWWVEDGWSACSCNWNSWRARMARPRYPTKAWSLLCRTLLVVSRLAILFSVAFGRSRLRTEKWAVEEMLIARFSGSKLHQQSASEERTIKYVFFITIDDSYWSNRWLSSGHIAIVCELLSLNSKHMRPQSIAYTSIFTV